MSDRLKITTALVREYEWDGKPFDELSRDELLEAVKELAKRVSNAPTPALLQDWMRYVGAKPASGPVIVADAYAHQRQPNYKGC